MINELICRYPVLKACEKEITNAKNILIDCFKNGNKLLLCGNGGSCADCDHIVGELMKGFLLKRPIGEEKKAEMKKNSPTLDENTVEKLQSALPAISLPAFSALNTAFCNDVDAELLYAQALYGLAKEGDVLLAISTSGNSKNVLQCAKVARAVGVRIIALTGETGGALRALADTCICAPEHETYKIQELHLPIYHTLCAEIEKAFFAE